jgi:hypothetical protein
VPVRAGRGGKGVLHITLLSDTQAEHREIAAMHSLVDPGKVHCNLGSPIIAARKCQNKSNLSIK